MNVVIILAGVAGNKMKSQVPLLLHKVCGKTLAEYAVESAVNAGGERIMMIWPYDVELLSGMVDQISLYSSLSVAAASVECDDSVLIVKGNIPLLTVDVMTEFTGSCSEGWAADGAGNICMAYMKGNTLKKLTAELSDDIIFMPKDANAICCAASYALNDTLIEVTDRISLAIAEDSMRERINMQHMKNGVTFVDPKRSYIDYGVTIGPDTIIYPGTIVGTGTIIGCGCIIGPNSHIIMSEIKDSVTIDSSKVVESYIDCDSTVGPFAYLRPGTKLGKHVKIGDFVEVKKSVIGDNSKSSHLSYIGDAIVGQNVNIGCGVVFVNYDGKNKHKTVVKDGAFIGSNSNLIAPVTVDNGGYVACGSTITDDVGPDDLAIARARQVNKKGRGKDRF